MSGSIDQKNPFEEPIITMMASWVELEATIKLMECATMRKDQAKAEQHRANAHSLLDIYMDAKQRTLVLVHHQSHKS